MVAQADLEVVGVVGRGDLHRAGAELHVAVFVGDDGYLFIHDGQDDGLADLVLIAGVFRMHGHGGVAQHGLGAGGGHDDKAFAVGVGIAQVPQVAGFVLVVDLDVGDGGLAVGAPVDDAHAAVDEALFVQLHEGLLHRLGAALVHGEALLGPVAGGAQGHQLLLDAGVIFMLPVPHHVQELFPAQIVAGKALFSQLLFHFRLGGDAGVVGAGQPEGAAALHAAPADQNVLHGVVQGVAHVQLARDVGRRHDDAEGLAVPVHVAAEIAFVQPFLIPLVLHLFGLVSGGQSFLRFSFHYFSPSMACPRCGKKLFNP